MARRPTFGNAPILESQSSAFRDFQDRRRTWTRPRNLRRVRGESGIELEGACECVSAGAPSILVMPNFGFLLAAGLLSASTLGAQQRARVDVLPPPLNAWADDAPLVSSAGLLTDPSMRDLLANGFPARLHYRLERWVGGRWFDDLKAASEWDVILNYAILGKKYQVVRVVNKKAESLGDFATLEDASAAVEAPDKTTIAPPKKGQRGYYNLLLDVETLSLSDLDEVERWLRGELKPAVSGKKNPGTALGRGVRTLVVRLLGGEKRHYEARTGKFKP